MKLGRSRHRQGDGVFCWMPPPLPVTVMGYVPAGVLLPP